MESNGASSLGDTGREQCCSAGLTLDPRINFGMYQNSVPFVRQVRIENLSSAALQDLTVGLWVEPDLSSRWERRVAVLDPGATWNFDEVDLRLAPERLVNVMEREGATLHVTVRGQDDELLHDRHDVEVLAFNEWGGPSSLPESLAAFVLPNHPEVEQVLRAARTHLERWTGDPSFEGYQTKDPTRVRKQAAAIYSAIADLDISYVCLPASFEKQGQKVHLPEQIMASRLGNCLDLSLLMAAAAEQAGLRPLLVLQQGHAFCGVWLLERSLQEPTCFDALRLKKRVEIMEACFFDSSSAASRPRIPFEEAERRAGEFLDDEDRFLYAVDLHVARERRIRPLPVRKMREAFTVDIESLTPAGPAPEPSLDAATSQVLDARSQAAATVAPTEQDAAARRLDRWKTRLLDLSLNNRLLNYRQGVKSLPFSCCNVAELEDRLAAGESFQVIPTVPEDDPRDAGVHRARTGTDLPEEMLKADLKAGSLRVPLPPPELGRRQLELWREARNCLEETGANTLYLALGFLEWYENDSPLAQRRLAPLMLLPAELVRGAFGEPYRVRLSDEEARVNVTLLEKLKRDYNIVIEGLDTLPTDASGIDVPLVLDTFRRAVVDAPRWKVVPEAHLGIFSFTKFLMWLDLQERSDTLLENDVVRSLVEGGREHRFAPATFLAPEQVDQAREPHHTFCPLDADSSQMAAVFALEDGCSFVLQGPPGTGKSQTITNMIAHSLAHGQTVLFVSEKRAALEVVHRRLARVGLSPFCLELHSNKASKSEVMRQLREAMEVARESHPREWELKAQQLQRLRTELDHYAEVIHAPRPLGRTVYEVTSCLVGLRKAPRVDLDLPRPEELTAAWFEDACEAVSKLEVATKTVPTPTTHAWRGARLDTWTPTAEREPLRLAERLSQALSEMRAAMEGMGPLLGLPAQPWSHEDLSRLAELCRVLATCPDVPSPLLLEPGWSPLRGRVHEWLSHVRARQESWAGLQERYREDLLALPLEPLRATFDEASRQFVLFAWLKLLSPRKVVGAVAKGPLADNPTVRADLERALAVVAEDRYLAEQEASAARLLGPWWTGRQTDCARIEQMVAWTDGARRILLWVSERFAVEGPAIRQACVRLCEDASTSLARGARLERAQERVTQALEALEQESRAFLESLQMQAEEAFGPGDAPGFVDRALQRLQEIQAGGGQLRDWVGYVGATRAMEGSRLGPLVKAHHDGRIPAEDLHACFERSVLEEWLGAVTSQDAALRSFRSLEHERKQEAFRQIDHDLLGLTRRVLRARLATRVPQQGNGSIQGSEMSVLERELAKKKRHLPCRRLFEKLPNLLPRLKPCFLMSPLSVAQYLDPALPPFDVIVFDEASQIPAWDAVGAMARGRRAVVVGDSKQLPPTSFFAVLGDGEDTPDEDAMEEAESILDECEASGMPRHLLQWHYRSRHESLIAFSNHHYYDQRLLTFPSATRESDDLGVRVRHVGGCFDRGSTRTNRAEAEAVVAEIVRRLLDERLCQESMGVVTFNKPQQDLVEDLLDGARREHPALEPFFSDTRPEPVFVKNLENVQGDERDVILFSTTYGPDAAGKVSHNFGPLNRSGGERRLNVAITRARRLLLVCTSLRPDQIDLSRTRAVGAAHLRTFLDYAARGPLAVQEAMVQRHGHGASTFEDTVAHVLEARGWTVHRAIGCSGYRIDLGIVHPDCPGSYLLGIECDGPSYHGARAARDRDRLRAEVLGALGWRMHRIWSTEWWCNFAAQVEALDAVVRGALEEARAANAAGAVGTVVGGTVEDGAGGRPPSPEKPPAPPDVTVPAAEGADPGSVRIMGASPAMPVGAPPAVVSDPRQRPCEPVVVDRLLGAPEAFYLAATGAALQQVLLRVVRQEGPISTREATRRVAAFWGIARAGNQITGIVQSTARRLASQVRERDSFYWDMRQDPKTWREYRVPNGPEVRDLQEIAVEELANAAEVVVERALGLPRDALARETARIFGCLRVGTRVRERLDMAIDLLVREGRCKEDEHSISLA